VIVNGIPNYIDNGMLKGEFDITTTEEVELYDAAWFAIQKTAVIYLNIDEKLIIIVKS
jgi:hypothetical protein